MLNLKMIPNSFDSDFYQHGAETNLDAYSHFSQFGKEQGLEGSPACNQGFFVRLIHHLKPSSILELGPGGSPKIKGENAYYFDVKDETELASRYKDKKNSEVPQKIHFVDKSGNLESIGRKFDVVFSSHVIEHVDDLIGHLKSIANLLNPGGLYFLIVPNKRYSFDHFKPISTVDDAIFAHFHQDGGNSLLFRAILLEHLRRSHNDPVRHWSGDHGQMNERKSTAEQAAREFQANRSNSVYRSGFHRWFFDECSFPEIVNALFDDGSSPLRVHQCYNTPKNSMSFNAILGF